jgi:branched-chain amino acid transport system permease protein
MSSAAQFYITSLSILFGINLIAVWGLDLQYGVTGIFNFAYIVFQSAGAYADGLFALHPAAYYQANETYVGGLSLPFPLPLAAAAAAGALLAIPIGFIAIRRLKGDYQAMAMLVLSLIATAFANAQINLVNGPTGISFIPQPLSGQLPLTQLGYQWVYLAFVAVVTLAVFWVMRSIVTSPFGRVLRAVRDSETAVASLGRDVNRARMTVFILGGGLAGLSGGLLVQYVTAWSPASWLYPETFVFFTIIIVGGTANLAGNVLGTLLVPILIVEGTRFLPQFGYPGLIDSLDWVVIGLVMLAFLWFRPQGLLPERRCRWVTFVPEGRRSLAGLLRLRRPAPAAGDARRGP